MDIAIGQSANDQIATGRNAHRIDRRSETKVVTGIHELLVGQQEQGLVDGQHQFAALDLGHDGRDFGGLYRGTRDSQSDSFKRCPRKGEPKAAFLTLHKTYHRIAVDFEQRTRTESVHHRFLVRPGRCPKVAPHCVRFFIDWICSNWIVLKMLI